MTTHGNASSHPELLRVEGVVFSCLVASIEESPEAEEKYTVPTILNRRPSQSEHERLNHLAASGHLAAAGYPEVGLILNERRLDVTNTTLDELHEGLALLLGALIQELSDTLISDAHHPVHPAPHLPETKREQLRKAVAELRFY
ncbi:hypothetical protein C6401_14005 [Arthrobacter woluwensis]|uniref:hypothetical protein n=1 Tax=Arthrobacter woluwensis TaxID=156980 RepID=UPI000D129A07|nr:hypothetical protein [Arthrobacter woluwensis]PSS43153.1 hypothetical protein C6401_14005 [Arthrobacter woluwensis]